jgi:hypothetical protein
MAQYLNANVIGFYFLPLLYHNNLFSEIETNDTLMLTQTMLFYFERIDFKIYLCSIFHLIKIWKISITLSSFSKSNGFKRFCVSSLMLSQILYANKPVRFGFD